MRVDWARIIRQDAPKYGLDPRAALAVSMMEGLSGRVGDGGHAFGPFQMNDAGGVLTGRPGNHRAYAESRQGIDDALSQMSRDGAKGLTGANAINAIVRRFERPAAPNPEVSGAIRAYGQGVGSMKPGPSAVSGIPALAGTGGSGGKAVGGIDSNLRMQLLATLMQGNVPGQAPGGTPSVLPLLLAARMSGAGGMSSAGSNGLKSAPVQPRTPSQGGNAVVSTAKSFLGTPYVFGGDSRSGIDCSALLQTAWAKAGVHIPRTTYDQWQTGKQVSKGQLAPGDAVFFRGSDARGNLPGHVGVYIGNGQMIEAPHTGSQVRVSSINRPDFVGARTYG